MLMSYGRLLGFFAVFLQIAVFLQPLLPEKYQVSPVCETIAQALQIGDFATTSVAHSEMSNHMHSHHATAHHLAEQKIKTDTSHHHHDMNHQCQYCVVYGHVVPLLDVDLSEVLVRIQVRYLAFKRTFFHVFFVLQQLFLIPQGRAPPLSLAI